MNTTRLMLNNTYDLFIPKNNTSFLIYFGLPNSPILSINDDDDDDLLISKSDLELDSDDTDDNKSNEILYKTFFSQLLHKFFVFDSLPFEEFQSELFLETCEDYFSLVGKFNSPIFAPIKADVNGNINKLRQKINENVMKFQTLYAIVNDEIESGTTNAKNSATDALLWLKRAFELISSFLHEFGMGDKTLADAVGNAYQQSLSRYHGMLARHIFSFALRAVPNNSEFLRSLAIDPNDASEIDFEHQVFNEMLDHASSMSTAFQKITLFYVKHELESAIVI